MTTSSKMWCFLLFTVILPIVPTLTEVVCSVSDCNEFLLDAKPPEIPNILNGNNILNQNRYKPICQTYRNISTFLTLYDIENRIPVFSAYKYTGQTTSTQERPETPWMIEPQLEDRNTNNMRDEKYLNQACDYDYKDNKDYNRGHLFPSCHAKDRNDKISTFTFTNIVPQAITFNSGSWERMETCIKCVLQKYCFNNNNVLEGFVVTGAVPSVDNKLKNRVNIPSILWSAFCCYNRNKKKWLASAHWGNNTAESEPIFMKTKTLNELYQKLGIKVFPETPCPLDETVADSYKDLSKKCQCLLPPLHTSASPTTSATAFPTISTTATTKITTNTIPRITATQSSIRPYIQFLNHLSKSGFRGCSDLCGNRGETLSVRKMRKMSRERWHCFRLCRRFFSSVSTEINYDY